MTLAVAAILWARFEWSDSASDSSSLPDIVGGHGAGGFRLPGAPANPDAEAKAEATATAAYVALSPEQVLQDVSRVRSEPFAPTLLDHLASLLPRFARDHDRLAAAALLHRYRRSEGTRTLREALRAHPGSPALQWVATALALARDSESIELLRDSMTAYLPDREFARALAVWAEPALLEQAATLSRDPAGPYADALTLLVVNHDPRAEFGLRLDDLLAATPSRTSLPYRAIEAARGRIPVEPVLEALREAVREPERLPAGWEESIRILGPARALPVVSAAFEHYSLVRREFAMKYEVHTRGVAEGTRGIPDLPAYPTASEARLREAIRLAREWRVPDLLEPLGNAQRAARLGRHSRPLSRALATAALHIDPVRGRNLLVSLGIPADEIEVARQLDELLPLPAALLPEQRGLALSPATPAEVKD